MLRTIAAAVSAVLVVLLLYTGYMAAVSDDLVVPTNGVIGKPAVDDPAEGGAARRALAARTEMQRWRAVSGPGPGTTSPAGSPSAATGPGTQPDSADVTRPAGGTLVRDWLNREADQSGLLHAPERIEGHSTLPGPVKDVFVQPGGRAWRSAHNGPIVFGGALYMVGVLVLLAVFLAIRGRVPIKEGFSGRWVPRFNAFERANHWMTAVGFVLLALTGLVLLYGKSLIRPWLGADRFSDLGGGSAWLHMALILPFALGLTCMILAWIRQNLPARIDLEWLRQGGGMLHVDGPNPPADRFNAGQKLIFWAVVLSGLALIASGVAMMFPFLWSGYDGMQLAQSIHAIVALVMIGIIFGHIYIGTVGMVGAFDAMWSGRVDRNWAKEHHSVWYRRLVGPEHPPDGPAE